MDKLDLLKDKVYEKLIESKVIWNDEQLHHLAKAMANVKELSIVSKEVGLLYLEEEAAKLDAALPLRDTLIDAIGFVVNGYDFDDFIDKYIESIPEEIDSAILYAYTIGSMYIQIMSEKEYFEDVSSFVPMYKMASMEEAYKDEVRAKEGAMNVRYMEKFFTTVSYTDDEVLESHIKATCGELRELTNKDILYLYEKAPDKFNSFMLYADVESRCRILCLINNDTIKCKALEFGKDFLISSNDENKYHFSAMYNVEYLVNDIHTLILNAYKAGELEGGSDKILKPDVKLRDMSDIMRNMGF